MDFEKKQRFYKTFMLIILTISITFILTAVVLYKYWGENKNSKFVLLPSSVNSELSADISKLRSIIDKYYIEDIDEQSLIDSALEGYIQGLKDEYSEFIPKKDMEDFTASTYGNYTGIGIYYGKTEKNNEYVVISPIKDSPAYVAGILSGDIIEKINDEDMSEFDSITEVANKIKGPEGTEVKLTIRRGEEIKEFVVERKIIKLHEITAEVLDYNIGYISISSFDQGTAKDFKEKYDEISKQGIKSLIIDLRDNGGGIVDEATTIADYMLEKEDIILITKDKRGKEELTKAKTGKVINLPIILLTNENTASASEILVGALRDNDVAKSVGEITYGKGVIQNVFTLTDGSGLKLTTSEYFTPNNNKINNIGIEPDVKVELPEELQNKIIISKEEDVQLQKAIEMLK